MRHFVILLSAVLIASAGYICCKKSPEPKTCWDSCPFPRKCFDGYNCECSGDMFFYANMCLASKGTPQYVALLPERDFLDTFALRVVDAMYSFSPQSNPYSHTGSQLAYYKFENYDSIFIAHLPVPGTGTWVDGWPTLNGKKFLFQLHGTIKHENRDTLYARVRWLGLGSGSDLQEPLDFKMYIPPKGG